jgi:hypothetical protein
MGGEHAAARDGDRCPAGAGVVALSALLPLSLWVPILDGDEAASDAYMLHYSSERSRERRVERGTTLTLGPGQKLVLATPCRRAYFAWRRFIDDSGQQGINRAWFRNVGAGRSSDLIHAADAIAFRRWPGERHYTYVDPNRVSANAGYCFKMAGWRFCGRTQERGLHVLERLAA